MEMSMNSYVIQFLSNIDILWQLPSEKLINLSSLKLSYYQIEKTKGTFLDQAPANSLSPTSLFIIVSMEFKDSTLSM